MLHSPDDTASIQQLRETNEAIARLKLQARFHNAKTAAELETAFQVIEKDQPDVMQVFLTALTFIHAKRIADFAAAQRIPAVYSLTPFVEVGGLLAYSTSYPDQYRCAAGYVDEILKGAKPADLPVQQPTTLELAINMKAAKALGVTFPPAILLRADRVIE